MGAIPAGSVVFVRFPFSDLSRAKWRPAVVLAPVDRGDYVLCQVTSKSYSDSSAVEIRPDDFEDGGLPLVSFARPGKLFTANERLFDEVVGTLSGIRLRRVIAAIVELLQASCEP